MNLKEALKILNIEDYEQRIVQSNSHGELFHLDQYFQLAEIFKDSKTNFREWFVYTVNFAEQNWKRPESIFQHILKALYKQLEFEETLTTT